MLKHRVRSDHTRFAFWKRGQVKCVYNVCTYRGLVAIAPVLALADWISPTVLHCPAADNGAPFSAFSFYSNVNTSICPDRLRTSIRKRKERKGKERKGKRRGILRTRCRIGSVKRGRPASPHSTPPSAIPGAETMALDHRPSLRKNGPFFEFLYVCPEPVLVK